MFMGLFSLPHCSHLLFLLHMQFCPQSHHIAIGRIQTVASLPTHIPQFTHHQPLPPHQASAQQSKPKAQESLLYSKELKSSAPLNGFWLSYIEGNWVAKRSNLVESELDFVTSGFSHHTKLPPKLNTEDFITERPSLPQNSTWFIPPPRKNPVLSCTQRPLFMHLPYTVNTEE